MFICRVLQKIWGRNCPSKIKIQRILDNDKNYIITNNIFLAEDKNFINLLTREIIKNLLYFTGLIYFDTLTRTSYANSQTSISKNKIALKAPIQKISKLVYRVSFLSSEK